MLLQDMMSLDSKNGGNFIEVVKLLKTNNEKVDEIVSKNALGNEKYNLTYNSKGNFESISK